MALHAAQAKPDANKAEEASSFALLVESAAPKATTNSSQRNMQNSSDRAPDDKQAVRRDDRKEDAKDNAPAAQTQPTKATQSSKPDETDKQPEDIPAQVAEVPAAPDAVMTDAAALLAVQQPITPPNPAPVNTAPANLGDLSAQAAGAAQAPSGPTAQPRDPAITDAAAAAPQKPIDPGLAANPANQAIAPVTAEASQANGSQPAESQAAKPQTASQKNDKLIESLQASVDMAANPAAQPAIKNAAPQNAAKTPQAVSKTAAPQKPLPANQNGTADQTKTEPTQDKSGDTKPNPLAIEATDHAPSPKAQPAPQAVQNAHVTFTVGDIAPPQTAQPVHAAQVAQNVQITPQSAPNLPALAVEIAAKSQSGAKQFEIRLDPPELGRVDVRLSIDATGKASAHLTADQPQTLSLLQKDAPLLTRALREAGLDVAQDGLNFSLRQQANNQDGSGANNNGRRGRGFTVHTAAGIEASVPITAYRGIARGRLDIRV
ncbi:MAG TPA: flagellar hook-length control protein FliK [Rhizomicrobium sp.]|nr:flagellar hook-length control protein FliK [Rhizomicrobium sp.]